MSRENVEIVRKMYETTTGKLDPDFRFLAPDAEFHLSGAFPDLAPVYRGHDGMRKLNDRLNAPWEEISLVPEKVVDLGERVLVLSHFDARGRDGIEVSLPFAHVWTMRNRAGGPNGRVLRSTESSRSRGAAGVARPAHERGPDASGFP